MMFTLHTNGTHLPEGAEALGMIEDALDHLVDGPRTSPSIVRRLLVRAYEGVPGAVTQRAIERFEDAYGQAYGLLPDPSVPPAAMDGGTRGRLLQHEATLRTEWTSVREGIVVRSANRDDSVTDRWTDTSSRVGAVPIAIPFSADMAPLNDVDPDEPILMLEPPELIARRERRRARMRAIGASVGYAALQAAMVGAMLAIVFAFAGIV